MLGNLPFLVCKMGVGSPVLPTNMTKEERLPDEGGSGADGHRRLR